jgi:WD40 repeat protein
VVGTILLIFNPLSINGLSELLKKSHPSSGVSSIMRSLHSVLLIPDNKENPIHILHKSFPDFLTDPDRCKDERFFINPSVHHQEVLLSCLGLMEGRLKRNICDLDAYVSLGEVEDLPAQRKAHIGDALGYACQFWTRHLVEIPSSSHNVEEIHKAINKFFTTQFLCWIEVLSLMGKTDVGVYAINNIHKWYTLVSCKIKCPLESVFIFFIQAGVTCQWVNDSNCFFLEHFDTICNFPLQIYYSALLLSPSSSWLHKYYTAELSKAVRVVKGLPAEWEMSPRTVTLDETPHTLGCWKDTIAVGLWPGDIIFLNATTGSQVATLSGHTQLAVSLTFSLDGAYLVSGSWDKTLKFWDVQTGGLIKTFCGHTNSVLSVSISPDSTTIASGSQDWTICLWDIQTGGCCGVIKQHGLVHHVAFSPRDPQHLISVSGCVGFPPTGPQYLVPRDGFVVRQWDINGNQAGPTHEVPHAKHFSNGTNFISCRGNIAIVQNIDSGEVLAKCLAPNEAYEPHLIHSCCSSNSKLMVASTRSIFYIWDITGSNPLPIKTFIGHTDSITSLIFSSPSTLVSTSWDQSVRFWQTGGLSTDLVAGDPKPTPCALASIWSVSLQVENGIAISSDDDGMVVTWDLSTGFCRASFQTPVGDRYWRDARVIDGTLVFAWLGKEAIYIWDTKKGEPLQLVDIDRIRSGGLMISGDGSRIFCLVDNLLQAWFTQTGEAAGEVEVKDGLYLDYLRMSGSRIWVRSQDKPTQGWDFGVSGSAPVPLSNISSECPYLHLIDDQTTGSCMIKDTTTGKEVFQLSGRYARPTAVQLDGWYLVAGYASGEVLILDFNHP